MVGFPTLHFSLPLPRIIPVTPVGPGLPGHRSLRPYTVFELEQVRQQSRKYEQWSSSQGPAVVAGQRRVVEYGRPSARLGQWGLPACPSALPRAWVSEEEE